MRIIVQSLDAFLTIPTAHPNQVILGAQCERRIVPCSTGVGGPIPHATHIVQKEGGEQVNNGS